MIPLKRIETDTREEVRRMPKELADLVGKYSFNYWPSPNWQILVVTGQLSDLVVLAEEIRRFGYELSGGIQFQTRTDGEAHATFMKPEQMSDWA